MNNISKFGGEISAFRNNSIDYVYSFNSAGNLFFMDTGSFNQNFLVISSSRFTYNDTGIKTYLDLEFREFVDSSSLSASVPIDYEAIANQLNIVVLSLQDLLLTAQSDASQIPGLTAQINTANDTISSLRTQLSQAQTTDAQLAAQLSQTEQTAAATQQQLNAEIVSIQSNALLATSQLSAQISAGQTAASQAAAQAAAQLTAQQAADAALLTQQQIAAASASAAQIAAVTSNVVVLAKPSMWVSSIVGGGSYTGGTTQTISVTPRPGFLFTSWSDGNQTNPRNIVVPLGNVTYEANIQQSSNTINAIINGQASVPLSTLESQFENLYLNGAYGTSGTTYVSGLTTPIIVVTNPLAAYDLNNDGSLDASEISLVVNRYNSGDLFLINWFGLSPNTVTGLYEPLLHPLTVANLSAFITAFNNYQITILTEENLITRLDRNNNGLTSSDFTTSDLQQTADSIFTSAIGASPTTLSSTTLQGIINTAYASVIPVAVLPATKIPTVDIGTAPTLTDSPTSTTGIIPLTGPTNVTLVIPTAPAVYGPI